MSQPFLGEVKIVSFNFPPKGWAFCNGQQLSIQQNQALFAVLGTAFGGNGQTTFGLPNLQGGAPMHWGTGSGLAGVTFAQKGGEVAHTLTVPEMPGHTHPLSGSSAMGGTTPTPGSNLLGVSQSGKPTYSQSAPNTTMVAGTVGYSNGGQPHANMQPYLVLNFVIALTGVYPARG